MKNLPDKIYLNFGDLTKEEYNELDFKDLLEATWSEDDVQGVNVEYIRKDAFIEKACEFIANNMTCNGYTLQTKAKFIRDFKKYMEY